METVNKELECGICLQICRAAVESSCCFHLFCKGCLINWKSCPICRREPLNSAPSHAVRRMISRLPVKCEHCQKEIQRNLLEGHKFECKMLNHKCSFCEYTGPLQQFFEHVNTAHVTDLLKYFSTTISNTVSSTQSSKASLPLPCLTSQQIPRMPFTQDMFEQFHAQLLAYRLLIRNQKLPKYVLFGLSRRCAPFSNALTLPPTPVPTYASNAASTP